MAQGHASVLFQHNHTSRCQSSGLEDGQLLSCRSNAGATFSEKRVWHEQSCSVYGEGQDPGAGYLWSGGAERELFGDSESHEGKGSRCDFEIK